MRFSTRRSHRFAPAGDPLGRQAARLQVEHRQQLARARRGHLQEVVGLGLGPVVGVRPGEVVGADRDAERRFAALRCFV